MVYMYWKIIFVCFFYYLKEFGDSKIRGEGALHTFKQHSNWISFNPLRFVLVFAPKQIQHDIPKGLLIVYICKM